jgi:hypothetical protein
LTQTITWNPDLVGHQEEGRVGVDLVVADEDSDDGDAEKNRKRPVANVIKLFMPVS